MSKLHHNPKRHYGLLCERHPDLGGERYVLYNRCIGCNRDAASARTLKEPHKRRGYAARSRNKTKHEVFERYGGMECALCGYSNEDALCLDHVDGDGGKLRKSDNHPWGGYALYVWLKNNYYPENLKFRVLCFNCNALESVKRLRRERRKHAY